ncbi:MAG: M15 family metallopeptidase [Oscillospiraceae bacterium]|nr:M15 family metallopeptidase [Oscillospiraceae bacterium]
MKRLISILLAAFLLLALAACGEAKPDAQPPATEAPATEAPATEAPAATETPAPEEPAPWTREGFFGDENENMLSVTWMEDVDEPGWYVGCMLGEDWEEDSWGGMLPQEGNSLKGALPTTGSRDPLTVTLTEEGADGLMLEVEGGETYHFTPRDIPKATIFVTINVEGRGNIDYAEGEEAPEIDPEYPFQSAVINLAEPKIHTFAAWPKAGNLFVKWTKNGEDFSADAQVTVLLEESADYVAVFEEDPDWQDPVLALAGDYQCGRAHAQVTSFGEGRAFIVVEWGSSAWELTRWILVGELDTETGTIRYTDGTKSNLTYDDSGEATEEETVYTDGTGTVVFNGDGTFTWHEDQSGNGEDMVFERIPASDIDYLALVNKLNPLPEGWEEALETVTITNSMGDEVEVEAKAYAAYALLKADLEENEGIYLELDSARRSVAAQQDIMDRFIEKYGADYAAKTVAQPGYSEHHTGLALDLYFRIKGEDGNFTDVYYNEDMEKEEYKGIWDAIHARLPRYGFILRYLEGEEHITGYRYEPWHIRYVDSAEIAGEIMAQPGLTLEEFLTGESAPEVEIGLSSSELYTQEELKDAVLAIKCAFAAWEGCELHAIRYAGDGVNNEDNLEWLNSLNEGANYTQIAMFFMDFHTAPDAGGAWEQDHDYFEYQWWLARSEGGDWEILTWGY